MKLNILALTLAAFIPSTAIFAVNDGQLNPLASTVTCRALDSASHELTSVTKSQIVQGVLMIEGTGDGFSFNVKFADASAILSLVNTNTGDKIMVQEGDFDVGEVVRATLETDEEPGKAISLECTAK